MSNKNEIKSFEVLETKGFDNSVIEKIQTGKKRLRQWKNVKDYMDKKRRREK